MRARALAGGLVAVAVLAGCGGSDSKAPEDTPGGSGPHRHRSANPRRGAEGVPGNGFDPEAIYRR